MNQTKEELQSTLKEAREKLWLIEDRERRDVQEAMIGKCFRYKDNSYGSGSGKWDVYYKVTGPSDCIWPNAFKFETDCNGKIEIDANAYASSGVESIPNSLFEQEWARVQKRIAKLCPAQPATTRKKANKTS